LLAYHYFSNDRGEYYIILSIIGVVKKVHNYQKIYVNVQKYRKIYLRKLGLIQIHNITNGSDIYCSLATISVMLVGILVLSIIGVVKIVHNYLNMYVNIQKMGNSFSENLV